MTTLDPLTTLPDYRARIVQLRTARGLSIRDAAPAAGLGRRVVEKIERGRQKNLYLDQVIPLVGVYGLSPADFVAAWPEESPPPPRPGPGAKSDAVVAQVRLRLRAARDRQGWGTPHVAEAAEMEQSTLVRWESGEYRRIDLIRLARVAAVLGADLGAWLTLKE